MATTLSSASMRVRYFARSQYFAVLVARVAVLMPTRLQAKKELQAKRQAQLAQLQAQDETFQWRA